MELKLRQLDQTLISVDSETRSFRSGSKLKVNITENMYLSF